MESTGGIKLFEEKFPLILKFKSFLFPQEKFLDGARENFMAFVCLSACELGK
jgi:hypothetical protein